MTNTGARETIDIENSGNGVEVETNGRTIVEVAIRGDAATAYEVQWREHPNAAWVSSPKTYSGSANYDDTIETGARDIRIECTSGTGTAGQSAEIILSAGGK